MIDKWFGWQEAKSFVALRTKQQSTKQQAKPPQPDTGADKRRSFWTWDKWTYKSLTLVHAFYYFLPQRRTRRRETQLMGQFFTLGFNEVKNIWFIFKGNFYVWYLINLVIFDPGEIHWLITGMILEWTKLISKPKLTIILCTTCYFLQD